MVRSPRKWLISAWMSGPFVSAFGCRVCLSGGVKRHSAGAPGKDIPRNYQPDTEKLFTLATTAYFRNEIDDTARQLSRHMDGLKVRCPARAKCSLEHMTEHHRGVSCA
jgi:hypothetical protein